MKHTPNPFFGKGKCIKRIRKENVQVSCWQNFQTNGTPYLNINIQIFYKSENGKTVPKKNPNFTKGEMVPACAAMNEMQDWLVSRKMPEQLAKILEARKEAARA